MKRHEVPMSDGITEAIMQGKIGEANERIGEALNETIGWLAGFSQEYDYVDLPFVIAGMKIVASSLELAMEESGRKFADNMVAHTRCAAINISELLKQMKEEQEGGTE